MRLSEKIGKNGVENTARDLSICDNLAAGVFFRILAGKKTIFKRKDLYQAMIISIIPFTPRRFITLRKS